MSELFGDKQKAWISAAIAFASTFLLQQLEVGEGPSAEEVEVFVTLTQEVITSTIIAAISWYGTYRVRNKGFVKVDEVEPTTINNG